MRCGRLEGGLHMDSKFFVPIAAMLAGIVVFSGLS